MRDVKIDALEKRQLQTMYFRFAYWFVRFVLLRVSQTLKKEDIIYN
jgi:hypothetical protein